MKRAILVLAIFALSSSAYPLLRGKPIPIDKRKEDAISAQARSLRDAALKRLELATKSNIEVRFADNGVPTLLKGRLTGTATGDKVEFALDFLNEHKDLFLLQNPRAELRVQSVKEDRGGNTHIRLNQIYQGLPVWGAQLLVHYSRDGYIKSVNGRWEVTPTIDIQPAMTAENALKTAKDDLKVERFIKEPTSQLIVFPWEGQGYLAWQITLIPTLSQNWKYFIDAKTGNILLKYNDVKSDGPVVATGIDLMNNSVPLNAYVFQDTVNLVDVTKPMYVPPIQNLQGVIATFDAMNGTTGGEIVIDPNGDTVFNDNVGLKASVSAHYNIGLTFDYFWNNFGRNSWDDNGGSLFSFVHYDTDFNNAFWDGSAMVFGDGDGITFSPLSGSLDVSAHELAHAITDATANLIYLGEWGALNEHISDVWGAMLDTDDWLIGEDVFTPGTPGDALRDMANPHNSDPLNLAGGPQPAHMNEYVYYPSSDFYIFDNGGVHTNSGIPNKACYLLASAIQRDTTEQLYYQALVYYLFQTSRFVDLRRALLSAADDIYSGTPNYAHILSSINNAFDAVGVYDFYQLGTNVLAYDDGSASYYDYIGPFGPYDVRWAVRFTPHAPCSLKAVTAQFYTAGTNGVLHVWAYSFANWVPGTELVNLNFNRTTIYPSWQTIDLSSYNLFFNKDFYIGFSSTELDSFLLFDSLQEQNLYTVYLDLLSDGNWLLFEPTDSIGDPLIRASIKYAAAPACAAAKGDLNGSGGLSGADVVALVNCVFNQDGTGTVDGNCSLCYADLNCTGNLSGADVLALISATFNAVPFPC